MPIALVGVNHRTAAVDVREKLGLAIATSGRELDVLRPGHAGELAIVTTCNRLEIYFCPTGSVTRVEDDILSWLAAESGLSREELDPVAYRKRGRDAIEHLLRVACGLDSQVLGETQILAQISQSFAAARTEETIGPLLTALLTRAIHAGKRARNETSISYGKTSISHAAAALVEAKLGGISGKHVTLIGAGETAALALAALRARGDVGVTCVNRSMARAETISALEGCEVLPWPALSHALVGADAVITATSAPHPVIYREELQAVLEERAGRPLLIVDIAVPRDVDSAVSELPGVELFDIDELEATLDEDRARREAAVPKVEEIVAEETDDALEWLRSRHIAPLIDQMRTSARAIADAEAQRVIRKLDDLDEREQEVIMRMARQVANKVLHEPIVLLKAEAAADRGMSTTAGDRDAPTSQGDA